MIQKKKQNVQVCDTVIRVKISLASMNSWFHLASALFTQILVFCHFTLFPIAIALFDLNYFC